MGIDLINRATLTMLATLNEQNEGLGVLEWLRKSHCPKATFFKYLPKLVDDGLVELKEIRERNQKIHTITEKGKLMLNRRRLIDLVMELPFTSSAEAALKLVADFATDLKDSAKVEVEGPDKLPSIDIIPIWLTKEDAGFPRKPMFRFIFNEKYGLPLQNIYRTPKATDLFQNICMQIWLRILSPDILQRFVNVADELDKKGLLRNYASTSYFGSMLADHFLLALENIAQGGHEEGVGTLIQYDRQDDMIKAPLPDRQQVFNRALQYAWKQLNEKSVEGSNTHKPQVLGE